MQILPYESAVAEPAYDLHEGMILRPLSHLIRRVIQECPGFNH